jgi:Fe-S cluster assembly iron-binding protein IscA
VRRAGRHEGLYPGVPIGRIFDWAQDWHRIATQTDRHRIATDRLSQRDSATSLWAREMFVERATGDVVFELTSRAAAALAETRAQSGLTDTIAIRISASESGNGSSAGYQVRFASHPAPNDVVVESSGTKVFLAEELVEPLEASVLDTVDTAQGEKLVLKHRTDG